MVLIRSVYIDFGHRCCGHCQLLLSTICLHTCCARFILSADVGGIFDMHLLSAVGLCRFVEHRWPHFQNDVCEFHASSSSSSINRHKFSWEYFHFIRTQELIYHAVATILLLAASLTLLIKIGNYRYTNSSIHSAYMAASVYIYKTY